MKSTTLLVVVTALGLTCYTIARAQCPTWNPAPNGNCPDNSVPPSACDATVMVVAAAAANVVVQTGHSSPEMSQAVMGGTCPGSNANTVRCQISTKMVSEGINSGENNYHGFRLKNVDEYNATGGTVCGCNTALSDMSYTVQLLLTGSATPGNRSNQSANIDYSLFYANPANPLQLIPLPILTGPTRVEVTMTRGVACANETPPGFALYLYSRGDNDDSGLAWEDAIVTVGAAWYDGDTNNALGIGWNDVARFIIEENQ